MKVPEPVEDWIRHFDKLSDRIIWVFETFYYFCILVFLDKYKSGNHIINRSLLWEYDIDNFDWYNSKTIVVQRVIELGMPEDYYAAFDLYGGIDGFREIIKTIPYLNDIDINFVCIFFNLKREELRCCTKKQLNQKHWNF